MRINLLSNRDAVLGDPTALPAADRSARASLPVALVSMPFVSAVRPSIQLGLLKPIAVSHGFPTETFHVNLDFSAQVGPKLYEVLCQHRGRATGDWLFSLDAFGSDAPDPDDRFLDAFGPELEPAFAEADTPLSTLAEIRHDGVPAYLDGLVDGIDWSRFAVVGFTSTFQQNTASFALARRLKAKHPELLTVFGGSNLEGTMGLEWVRSMPMIDYAINGEADLAFSRLLVALAGGGDPLSVPGVVGRRDGEVVATPNDEPFDRLDEAPVPDYDEYFARMTALDLLEPGSRREVYLPFESARGCWWGAKRHCTFCGLNGGSMSFRAKSPQRVEAEMAELVRRYHSYDLEAVDNIMERSYIEELFSRLAEQDWTYRIFYEVKADLTPDQLRTLRLGGIRRLQPGIESLSSHVLGLMRKGTRSSTNVNLLRWCTHYGIDVGWNMIWGFPGETLDDVREQVELVPQLAHLHPPGGSGRIWMERYSPIFTDRESFPATIVRPEASLSMIYPDRVSLDEAAYFFDYQLEDTLDDPTFLELGKRVEDWIQSWQDTDVKPTLALWRAPGIIQIEDHRNPDEPGTHTFEEPLASVYLATMDKPVKAEWVRDSIGLPYPVEEVVGALDEFCARGLMLRDGNLFLALAIPATGGLPRNCGTRPLPEALPEPVPDPPVVPAA